MGESTRSRSGRTTATDVERLVREIQAGRRPEENFRRLYERYYPAAVHLLLNRGVPPARAEDLAQDALIRVYENMGKFRFEASFDTWLRRVVLNLWRNDLRDRAAGKRAAPEISLEVLMRPYDGEQRAAGGEPEDPREDPLDLALADERARLLGEAVDRLPPRMRECMLLRLGQGLKYREIASVLRVSLATVKSQISAANQRLKPLLEKHFDVFLS